MHSIIRRKFVVVCIIGSALLTFWIFHMKFVENEMIFESMTTSMMHRFIVQKSKDHEAKVSEFYAKRKNVSLSELGRRLFLNENSQNGRSKQFSILIWKDGVFLERRHLRYFQTVKHDPFETCSVKNCKLTYENTDVENADAVVFLLHRLSSPDQLPTNITRPAAQRWIFITDESPFNTFLNRNNKWTVYNGIFNWSMSYKMESDIPVPYGRTLPIVDGEITLKEKLDSPIPSLIPNFLNKRSDVLAAIMTSHCKTQNGRMEYVHELQKHIEVDVYGGCGTTLKTGCPGHFDHDCAKLEDYRFYLAFENSDCDQYITEKLYWNAYEKGAIPIIMGTHPKICEMHLPPNSYIHVKDFAKPVDLARYILYISDMNNGKYFEYHEWRKHFRVVNEHGYFGNPSVHYCRICEGLNYNSQEIKVYDDLSYFLSPDQNCVVNKN